MLMFIEGGVQKKISLPELPHFDIEGIKEFALSGWVLGATHGMSHWQRVERNGILLSMHDGCLRKEIYINVVRAFAYLHDKCRIDDYEDYGHGVRSANMIPTIRDTVLAALSDDEIALLERACRYHTTAHFTGDPTVDVCFDADRLDLGRVGISPNPKLMATEQGAYYAANKEEFRSRTIELDELL